MIYSMGECEGLQRIDQGPQFAKKIGHPNAAEVVDRLKENFPGSEKPLPPGGVKQTGVERSEIRFKYVKRLGSVLIFDLPGGYRVKYYCTESEAKIEKDAIIGMMKVSRKSVVVSIGEAGGAYCDSLPWLPEK